MKRLTVRDASTEVSLTRLSGSRHPDHTTSAGRYAGLNKPQWAQPVRIDVFQTYVDEHDRVVLLAMAGANKRRKQAFFAKHPTCCFCGGEVDATEMDHLPARHLFRERYWPEGYVFPACGACNDAAADDELIMGFIVRIQISDLSEVDVRELESAIAKMHDRHPEIVNGLREMSRNDTRRMLRENGLSIGSFPKPIYVVAFPEEILDVAARYGRKIGKALYYLHTGTIFPNSGRVFCEVIPNANFMSVKFPIEAFQIFQASPAISRNGKSLANQFAYRWGMTLEMDAVGFLVQFGESTVMLITAFTDAEKYEAALAARAAETQSK